ncbi:MFS transporter [Roseateles noduli]|uniref:MFS transporter n=1 Tax=Roseateles noduli TaxID=2052484 RepID=UPI003D65BF29
MVGLTQGLGVFLVNNNYPAIQGALGATSAEGGWLTTAYFATSLSCAVILTKMRLQYGLRRFAEWGIFVYLLVSVINLVVRDLQSALVARAALGLAATPLITLSLLYMLEAFPKRFAPYGITLGFAALQFGSPLARIISESLLEHASWRGLQLFDLAMACACLAAINAVRLTPPPLMKVFNKGDALSFSLYATALALLCVVFTQGRVAWWTDAPWIGGCLAAGIGLLGIFVMIELRRERPLIDLRWVCTPPVMTLAITIILFRLVLSEQPFGVVTMMYSLGITNDQMHGLFWWVTFGTAAGFLLSLLAIPWLKFRYPALVSLLFIFAAAWMDTQSTAQTRPEDLYLSQTLLAIGTSMFLMSALLTGFIPVILDGMRNVISFFAVFAVCNQMGSLMGSAALTTLLAERQSHHFAALSQWLRLSDPQVAARVAQGGGAYAGTLVDSAQRSGAGLATLMQQTSREALIRAYNDVFFLIAALAVCTFIYLLVVTVRFEVKGAKAATPAPQAPNT